MFNTKIVVNLKVAAMITENHQQANLKQFQQLKMKQMPVKCVMEIITMFITITDRNQEQNGCQDYFSKSLKNHWKEPMCLILKRMTLK